MPMRSRDAIRLAQRAYSNTDPDEAAYRRTRRLAIGGILTPAAILLAVVVLHLWLRC